MLQKVYLLGFPFAFTEVSIFFTVSCWTHQPLFDLLSFTDSYFRSQRTIYLLVSSLAVLSTCSTPSLAIFLNFFMRPSLKDIISKNFFSHCNALYFSNELCYGSVCSTHARRGVPHWREPIILSYLLFSFIFFSLVNVKANFVFKYGSMDMEVGMGRVRC